MERVAFRIGARQSRCAIAVNSSEDVVVGKDVVKAQVLDRSAECPDGGGIASELNLGVCDTNLHEQQFSISLFGRLMAIVYRGD
jgi:hypothetical protein